MKQAKNPNIKAPAVTLAERIRELPRYTMYKGVQSGRIMGEPNVNGAWLNREEVMDVVRAMDASDEPA